MPGTPVSLSLSCPQSVHGQLTAGHDAGPPGQQRLQSGHPGPVQNIPWNLQASHLGGLRGVHEQTGSLSLLVVVRSLNKQRNYFEIYIFICKAVKQQTMTKK